MNSAVAITPLRDESPSIIEETSTSSSESSSVSAPAYLNPSGQQNPIASDSEGSETNDEENTPAMEEPVENSEADQSEEESDDESSEEESSEEESSEEESSEEESSEEESTEEESEEASTEDGSAEDTAEEENAEDANAEGESDVSGGSVSGTGTADQSEASEEDAESIEVMVGKIPSMRPIISPYVPGPPPQAIQRRDEILKRTGAPPDLHHARVRQLTEQVTQASRDAQRRMINHITMIGRDSRLSIEKMADEIAQATSAAVAQIHAAIKRATTGIKKEEEIRQRYLDNATMLVGSELEKHRDQVTVNIANSLREGSAAVRALDQRAQQEFTTYVDQARAGITLVPTAGKGTRIPDPPLPPGAPARRKQKPPKPKKYYLSSDTRSDLTTYINDQAETKSRGDGPNCATYYRNRVAPYLTGYTARTQNQLVKSAETKAKRVTSPATRAQFLISLLGLTTPAAEHHENDESEATRHAEDALREQMSELDYARHTAKQTIKEKSGMAIEYMDTDLRKNLTSNLWKSGKKAINSFRKQALAAEIAQQNNAASFAESYRSLVEQLKQFLPPGELLDSRKLGPQLLKERDKAGLLQQQHEGLAKQQSDATLTQMDQSKQEQIEGLEKAAREGSKNVANVVTQTAFDMEVFVQQVTTGASEGATATMSAGATYANDTAQHIVDSIAGPTSSGVLQIQNAAVGFLNGNISAAEQSQYAQLESFVETMQGEHGADGPLSTPMQQAKSLFEGKADRLHNHMPEPASLGEMAEGGGLLLGAAMLVPGVNLVAVGAVGIVGAGVYLYNHDPSENGVIIELGDVVYPGTRAIGEVFARKGHGNLENRISTRLDDPEKQQALDLFSETASVRGDARRHIAERSTEFFGYNRAAREAALSGMSAEESAAMNPDDVAATRELLESELDGHQEDVAIAFLEHNREAAVAARTRESLDNGVRDSSWGWRFTAEAAVRDSDAARTKAVRDMDSSLRSVLAIENGFAEVMSGAELHDSRARTFREFASLTSATSRTDRRAASDFSDEAARSSFISYATRPHESYLVGPRTAALVGLQTALGPLGPVAFNLGLGAAIEGDRAHVEMSSTARDYITAMVNEDDQNSDAVRNARGIYEIQNAESEGTPSETTQLRLAQALENRALAQYERDRDDPRLTPEERSRAGRLAEEERVRHRERLRSMAVALGAGENITPEAAEDFMRARVGSIYARTDTVGSWLGEREAGIRNTLGLDSSINSTFMSRLGLIGTASHSRFGEEMITHGRASLDASVALATDGVGTNEDLLLHGYADRSTTEIAAANARWAREHHGESMEAMLGIRNDPNHLAQDLAIFAVSPAAWLLFRSPETSGDLAMQLEVLARGNPVTDEERLAIAQLRQEQQTRGFAFIADAWMRGTPEEAQMTTTRASVSSAILARALEANPTLRKTFDPENPNSIYRADGSIDPRVRAAAFDSRGNFTGDRSMFSTSVSSMGQSADAYRAGVDRREAMLTQFITVMAIIASIAAMLIPGVNMVVAGVAIALIAGAATITVKAGMRGARYGWEEAATDVATTAIEAATAGIGGALGGGLGTKGMLGALGRVGQSLEKNLGGKIAAAIVREAVVNAMSTAASTAIQDETWKDGFGKGISRVANGAIRGAVVGGISGGLSTALTTGLSSRMSAVQRDATKVTALQRLGQSLGPKTSEMIREGIANGVSTMASEIAGLGIDYAQGNFHGTFLDAVKHVGLATLRETVSGAARAGITAMHKEHYRTLLTAAQKSGNLGPAELKLLRLVGISAGVLHYNDSLGSIQNEIKASRDIIARMPPEMREHLSGMDHSSLANIAHLIDSADIKYRSGQDQQHHLEFMRSLADLAPGFDPRKLMQQIDDVIDSRRSKSAEPLNAEQQTTLRQKLGAELHEGVKFTLDTLPIDALQHLTDTELKQAASMIASGEYSSQHADQLMRAVKSRNPNVDEHLFLKNLQGAVIQSRELQQTATNVAMQRRQQLVQLVPPEAAPLFAHLSPLDATLAHNLLSAGNEGTPHQQEMLFQSARKSNPHLTSEEFKQIIIHAAGERRQQLALEAGHQRAQREASLTHLPKELRNIISALPDSGLIELKLRQMDSQISHHQMERLLKLAQDKTPDVDVHALRKALEQAVAEPPKAKLSEAETAELQRHLLSAIPDDQRAQIAKTPILVVSDAEFAQLTRSKKGQAVTLIIDGHPVVVMREGANPRVLREEGIHALQAKDPQWKGKVGVLDESIMEKWDSLSLEEQLGLYRNKLALEMDAQHHLITSLEKDIANANTREERRALQKQLEQIRATEKNLKNRMQDVGAVSDLDIANIKAGFTTKPQWLDQPARLFNKTLDAESKRLAKQEHSNLIKKLSGDPELTKEHHSVLKKLSLEELRQLSKIVDIESSRVRQILGIADAAGDTLGSLRKIVQTLDGLSLEQSRTLLNQLVTTTKSSVVDVVNGLHSIRQYSLTAEKFYSLIGQFSEKSRVIQKDLFAIEGLINSAKASGIDPSALFHSAMDHKDLAAVLNRIIYDDSNKQRHINEQTTLLTNLTRAIDVTRAHSPDIAGRLLYMMSKSVYQDFHLIAQGLATANKTLRDSIHFVAFLDTVINSKVDKLTLIDNFNKVVTHLDEKSKVALLSLLEQMGDADRIDNLAEMAMVAEHVLPELAKHLGVDSAQQLLAVTLETVSTQRNWHSVASDMFDLAYILINLPKTPENLTNIKKIVDYILSSRGDINKVPAINLSETDGNKRFESVRNAKANKSIAADISAAMDILRNSANIETSISNMIVRLDGKDKSLAGGDAWLNHLEEKKSAWKNLTASTDKDVQGFVKALQETTKGMDWGDGELGSLDKMQVWFKKLAESRGIDSTDAPAMAALMKEVFTTGFAEFKSHTLTSEGKLKSLERAFREMTTHAVIQADMIAEAKKAGRTMTPAEADAEMNRRTSVDEIKKDPKLLKTFADELGLPVDMLLARADADNLLEHIATLKAREQFYAKMESTADSIKGSKAGIVQNITEVKGEIALTQRILKYHKDFKLEIPFGKGTGFDQVWSKNENGKKIFIVGEAKGPGADLGSPLKGPQMSAQWILNTLPEMLASGKGSAEHRLALEMLAAIKRHLDTPGSASPIRGLVIEHSPPNHNDITKPETGQGGYKFEGDTLKLYNDILKQLRDKGLIP